MQIDRNYKNIILIVVILGVIIYANSFGNSFVWDDTSLIVKNDLIRNWRYIPEIFTSHLYHSKCAHSNFYRPVLSLSFLFDYSIWKLNPFGYHLTNTLLHIFNAILIYFLISSISNNKKMASITSLLFVVHPIHTEAVTYISGRADPLATLFFLLSILLFIKHAHYVKIGKIYLYAGSVAAFILAVLAKETALILPLILILYDRCFAPKERNPRFRKKTKLRYLPYLIGIVLYIYWRILILGLTYESSMPYDLYSRLLTASKVIISYIGLLFLPFNLHMERFVPISSSFFELPVLFSIASLAIISIIIINSYKRSKIVFFSCLWFFIALLPVSNILPLNAIMAEHWLYLPSIGFFVIMAMGIVKIAQWKISFLPTDILRGLTVLLFAALFVFYSGLTIKRNPDWKDNLTVFEKNLESSPNSAIAHYHLGFVYHEKEIYDKAIYYYKEALKIEPGYAEIHNNLGGIYNDKGMTNDAVAELRQAIKADPNYAEAHNNLGIIYNSIGMYKEAINELEKAVSLNPAYVKAHYQLGIAYSNIGEADKAIKEWERVFELNPDNESVRLKIEKAKKMLDANLRDKE